MGIEFFHIKSVSRHQGFWWQGLSSEAFTPPPQKQKSPPVRGTRQKFFGEMFGGLIFSFYLCTHKRGQRCLSVVKDLSHGVMASTTGFGSVSQGSNPCGTTTPAGGVNKERRSPLLLYRNTTHLLLSKRDSVIGCHTRWWRANRQEVDTDCPMV